MPCSDTASPNLEKDGDSNSEAAPSAAITPMGNDENFELTNIKYFS
ncbi:hypothetical protein BH23BAC3_BH23BAC3_35760 [soil metagenome]